MLEAAGHRLVRFDPPDVPGAFSLFVSAVSVDGGTYLLNRLDNDILDSNYKVIQFNSAIYDRLRKVGNKRFTKWLRSLTARRKTRVQSPAAPSLGVRQATTDRGFSVAVSSGCQHSKARKG